MKQTDIQRKKIIQENARYSKNWQESSNLMIDKLVKMQLNCQIACSNGQPFPRANQWVNYKEQMIDLLIELTEDY